MLSSFWSYSLKVLKCIIEARRMLRNPYETPRSYHTRNRRFDHIKRRAEFIYERREQAVKRARASGEFCRDYEDPPTSGAPIKRKRSTCEAIAGSENTFIEERPRVKPRALLHLCLHPHQSPWPSTMPEFPEADVEMSPPFVDPPATEHATAPVFDSFAPTSVPEVDVAMMSDHMANSQANPLPAYEEWTVPNITISPAVVEGSQPSMELPEQDFSSVADDFYSTPPIAIVPPSVVNTPFIDKENVAPLPMPTLPNEQSWSASAVDEPSLSRTEPSLSSTEPSWFPFEEPSLPTPTIALREPAVSRRRRNIPLPHDPLLAETALPSYGTPSTHRHEKVSRNRHNPYTKKYEERTRDPRPRPKLSNTSPQDDLLDGLDAFSSLPTVSPMGRRSRPSSRRHRHQPLAGSLLFSDVSFIKGEMHVGYPPGFEDPYVLREVDRLLSQDVTVTPPSPEPEEPTEPVCEHDALADAFANTTLEPTNEDPAQASNEDEGDDDQEERVYTEKDIFGVDTDDEGFDSDATRGPQTPAASEEVVDAFLESVVAQVRLTNPTDLDFFYPEFSPVMTADEKDAAMLASLMQRTSV